MCPDSNCDTMCKLKHNLVRHIKSQHKGIDVNNYDEALIKLVGSKVKKEEIKLFEEE